MNLVVVPFHDWKKCEREGFRTRDGHLMQEFGRDSRVDRILIINRPISIAEILLLRRNITPKKGTLVFRESGVYITKVTDRVYTLDILIWDIVSPLLLRRNWIPGIFSLDKVYDAVIRALEFLQMADNYKLMLFAPISVPLARRLQPTVLVVDALDNLLKHAAYRNLPGLRELYQYCIEKADVLTSNSRETTEWFKQFRADAQHIPNGVDSSVFDPDKAYQMPDDMVGLPRPIIGYAGKMQEMFDVDLLLVASEAIPHASFVLIGQVLDARWMKRLWERDNVHYLGDKEYASLPSYLAAFDLCLIPYSMDRQHGVDPIKFYEYWSMRKPIVTTDIGNVSLYAQHSQIRVATTGAAFLEGIKAFVMQLEQGRLVTTSDVPKHCQWHTKATYFVDAILASQV